MTLTFFYCIDLYYRLSVHLKIERLTKTHILPRVMKLVQARLQRGMLQVTRHSLFLIALLPPGTLRRPRQYLIPQFTQLYPLGMHHQSHLVRISRLPRHP